MSPKVFLGKLLQTGGAIADTGTDYAESLRMGAKEAKLEAADSLMTKVSSMTVKYGYNDTDKFITDFKQEVDKLMDF